MFKSIGVVLLVVTSMAGQAGQQLTSVAQRHKPGDTLHYIVTFDGDPAFDNVSIYFQAPSVPPDQSGLTNGFSIGRSKKVTAGTFEVEGEIPGNAASGSYQLLNVNTRIAPYGASGYDAGRFHDVIAVDNGEKYVFPPLKSIAPK